MNNPEYSYLNASQNDLDTTRDDLEEERIELERRQEELNRTNLFKTRVIESEINSSLVFQISLYYNFFYSFLCFALQISSVSYKLYIYKNDNFAKCRLVLVLIWIIVEMIRLHMGYKANIQELFYDYLLFILVTVIFVTPFQLILILGNNNVFPIDYATTIVLLIFEVIEIIFCIRAMCRVSKRQSALFYLRNSQTLIINPKEKIKTSSEIEEELYIKFPMLKQMYYSKYRPGSGFPAPRSFKKTN